MKQQQQASDYSHSDGLAPKSQKTEKPHLGDEYCDKETINEAIDHGKKDVTKEWTK
jgi:hypothetical protein